MNLIGDDRSIAEREMVMEELNAVVKESMAMFHRPVVTASVTAGFAFVWGCGLLSESLRYGAHHIGAALMTRER